MKINSKIIIHGERLYKHITYNILRIFLNRLFI